jgi:hypothetical protein
VKKATRNKTEIFSIFGQCESVVAEMMVSEGKLTRIEPAHIPPTAAVNDFGTHARFAVVVQPRYLAEFNRRCAEMRS